MAEKILKQNKIPGCERLTRPEEIKALSKYLKARKEELEERTDLGETSLEIPGKTTGQLHDITELPGGYDRLEIGNSINSLSDTKIGLLDPREPELTDYREGLEDNRTPELSDHIETLEDTREQSLSDYRESLEDTREPKLSDYIDTIQDSREPKLSDYLETLGDTKEPELPDYKDTLEDTREQALSDYREDLVDDRNPELPDYKETITDEREPKLSDIKETISDSRDTTLSDYREDLVDDRNLELPDYKDTLLDTREPKLSDSKITLEDTDVLGDSLPSEKSNLWDPRDIALGDTRLDLTDSRENALSDVRIDISDPRENALSDVRIDISDPREPSLEDTRLDLNDPRENELEDYVDPLSDPREPSLEDYVDPLGDPREPALEDYIDDLDEGEFKDPQKPTDNLPLDFGEFKEPSLYDTVLDILDEREPALDTTQIPIQYGPGENPRIDSEYDYIDNSIGLGEADPIIQQKAKNKFEAHRKVIDRPENSELDARIDGVFPNNEWNTDGSPGYYGSFDDIIPKIQDDRNIELGDTQIPMPSDDPTDQPEHNFLSDVSGLSDTDLYNLILELAYDKKSELTISDELREKLAALVSTYLNPGDELKPISPRNAHRFEDELYRAFSLVSNDGSEQHAPLSGGSDGTARIDGEYNFIDNNPTSDQQRDVATEIIKDRTTTEYQDIPPIQLPEDSTELQIEFIRYAAEQSVGMVTNRTERKYLLTEALWALVLARRMTETTTGINRDRLPGRQNTIGTLLDDANRTYQSTQWNDIVSITNSAYSLFAKYLQDKPNPINRPEVNAYGKLKNTTAFELGNARTDANAKAGYAGVINNLWDQLVSTATDFYDNVTSGVGGILGYDRTYNFKEHYLQGGGIVATLSDLCEKKEVSTIGSVEDLLDTLKSSPYITTPAQFGTLEGGRYGTQTLDSNSYWEVVIEPFCDNYLNGGYSYLPCFDEINVINHAAHGVTTAYNKWVPISNFELQKAKLTTKSIGLYDGEFSFPISAELTNEIRFTIVDDQYKSWRNYFQKCMDVAVYNSEPHEEYYYKHEYYYGNPLKNNGKSYLEFLQDSPSYLSSRVTAVDKSIISVAFYKNITFRIKIYVMTPQYSTIRRFDLLCVLKDFVEEYSGDIDSGGVDLNVTFSIVGENPDGISKEASLGQRFIDTLDSQLDIEFSDRPIQSQAIGLLGG